MISCAALVIGLHLHTFHKSEDMKDQTPGLYAVAPCVGVLGGSLTAGVYRNSLDRTSFYLGQTWESESGRFSLTLAAATGYQITTRYGQEVCRPGYISVPGNECRLSSGGLTRAVLSPLVIPSMALPELQVASLTPRVSLLWHKKPALHLLIEKKF